MKIIILIFIFYLYLRKLNDSETNSLKIILRNKKLTIIKTKDSLIFIKLNLIVYIFLYNYDDFFVFDEKLFKFVIFFNIFISLFFIIRYSVKEILIFTKNNVFYKEMLLKLNLNKKRLQNINIQTRYLSHNKILFNTFFLPKRKIEIFNYIGENLKCCYNLNKNEYQIFCDAIDKYTNDLQKEFKSNTDF